MVNQDIKASTHPTELELSAVMSGELSGPEKAKLLDHVACCEDCLKAVVSAHESVNSFNEKNGNRKIKGPFMKKINIYLAGAVITFSLSFIMPRFFIQFLVATMLFGIKWIVDSKSTRMLIMIYEAWKNGGEKEASRIIEALDNKKKRF